MQAHDRYFHSGGARLRYRDQGEGDPVVFLHGWTVDLDVWEPQARLLSDSLRVVRLDRRGFGLSEGASSLDADCADLRALLDHLGVRHVALVGASQGARVALAFALLQPDRVTSAVLDGPPDETGGAGADAEFSLDEFRERVRKCGVASFKRAWQAHPLMRLHSGDPEMAALLAMMLERYPARDLMAPATDRPAPTSAGALAKCHLPMLVVNGEFDTPVRLLAGERLVRALPHAERLVMPRAGHWPNLDAPHAYSEAIAAFFLRRQSRAAA